MTTWTALTTLDGKSQAEALGEALERLEPAPQGVGVFEIEDGSGLWEVGGFFTGAPDQAGLALLATLYGANDFAVSKLEDRDWVAQVRRELTPVEAGRFWVYGGHDRDRLPSTKIGLEIEAAMAFGTGHHGTTQGCLLALDGLLRAGFVPRNVADIGAGTGVLAMAAARAVPTQAIAADIDPVATATARANMRANRLGVRVPCVTAPGFHHPLLRTRAPFDLVFGNILARPLKRLAPDMARFTAPGARLILSGILNRQATGVVRAFEGAGFGRPAHFVRGEWTTLVMTRQ
ncbi:MAG: 50S ribosomal protein L11 methyltransferase [Pseudomonadota bacterium]